MFHPLIKLLAARPDLLAEHAGAYAHLASLQLGQGLQALRRRALATLVATAAAVVALLLAGVALLLLAVVPVQQMPAPWLLAAVPGLPALLAAVLAWRLHRGPGLSDSAPLQALQAQWAADAQLLREAGAA